MNKKLVTLIIFLVFFAVASYFANQYESQINDYLDIGYKGVIVYFLVEIASIVFAPLTTIVFLPIAVSLWGPFWAATFSVISWFIGSVIVFYICRFFDRGFLEKYTNIKSLQEYENSINNNQKFVQLILLRMIIPVDILSYGLGLFTNINFKMYATTTLIGITPFAFLLSYFSEADLFLKIVYGFIIIVIISIVFIVIRRNTKST